MSTSQQSARRTFFTSVDWPALKTDSPDGCDIRVDALCSLGESVTEFFQQLGASFKPARSDVAGNVRKMADAVKLLDASGSGVAASDEFHAGSVGQLLQFEQTTGSSAKDPSGTVGLLWFKRALEYLYAMLCLLHSNRSRAGDFGMSDLCRRAYELTLRPRHAWLVQKTFGLVISLAPRRSQFLACLAYGDAEFDEADLYDSMAGCLVDLRRLLERLNAALCRFNAESPPLPDLAALAPMGSQAGELKQT